MSPRVRFEPLGEEIECGPEETVLDAAFRQGYNLAYGCREGQCSACKCYLLEGEVDLKPYSTFALSDTERSSGYALMCRALPERDAVIELLHYDPDNYRLQNAIRDEVATVESVTELTHDIVGLTLRVDDSLSWLPGQYLDIHVPGEDGARRSFSIANLPGSERVELMIKRYPGGRFSSLLGNEIDSQTQLHFTGPYGAFHLRRSERPILMVAGGSGMAPVLAVLRQLAHEGCERPVRFFYGAREERDLFAREEIAALGERLPNFRFLAVTGRFVHEAIDEELAEPDVYMCGPPPMLEAVEAMLAERGIDPSRIFQDKFTTSAAAGESPGGSAPEADGSPRAGGAPGADGPPGAGGAPGAAPTRDGAPASERDFSWYTPAGRRATIYEDVTIDTQPSIHRHLARGWPLSFEDGRGTWNDASTALRSSDWFDFRDPGQQWERPFYQAGTAVEHQIEGAVRSAAEQGLIEDFAPRWVEFLGATLQVPAFVEHGLWFALATAARDGLSDSVATCMCLQAALKQRSAQAIVLYAMDLEQVLGRELPIEDARGAFMADAAWQPVRRYLERLAATPDWAEVVIAANLCFEPTVATLIRRELGTRAAAANGDTVTPVLARAETQEWEWARSWTVALTRFLLADPAHGAHNRTILTGWVGEWLPEALAAATALAPVGEPIGVDAARAGERIGRYAGQMLAEAGLPELCELVGYEPPEEVLEELAAAIGREAAQPVASAPPPTVASAPPPTPAGWPASQPRTDETPTPDRNGSYDYVGIVMAKSAEGDAVARFLARREGIEVLEQPAFWDIRASERLVIPYAEVTEEVGYEIDAYSIQHEMSTHYGRMVATDDALMLFSDPTEAMEHLLS
jgi:NAD(P)H-flavin reductase/ferredoxin